MTEKYLPQLDSDSDRFDRLPRECAARLAMDDSPILIKRGESGYFPLAPATDVDKFNADRGITEAQVNAMEAGSMFGWECPGADPLTWTK